MKILAVTVLTSLDRGDLDDSASRATWSGWCLRARGARWRRAATASSRRGWRRQRTQEPSSRSGCWSSRRASGRSRTGRDDQKRTVDVAQAFANGADYIVVGRPIRQAADPRAAAEAIQETIATIFPA